MPRINLFAPLTAGGDKAETSQGGVEIMNGYIDNLAGDIALKQRPGLTPFVDTQLGGRTDIYWWEAKRTLIITAAGKIYAKTSQLADIVDITSATTGLAFPYNARVFFAADEHGVTMSIGGRLMWWGGNTSLKAVQVTGAYVPTNITSLAYLKGYIIASVLNTQTFAHATYGPEDSRLAPPVWQPLTQSASASPDDIICLGAGWEELFILGRESTQAHYVSEDPIIPFPALSGSASEVGIISARTLNKLNNVWMFTTPNKQVVRMEGRVPTVISRNIDQELRRIEGFELAESFTLFDRFYVLTFPTGKDTFVYDSVNGLWYKWGKWDANVAKYRKFIGISSAMAKYWGKQLMGGFNGKVYEVDHDVLTDGGEMIRLSLRSANLDHGTTDRKFSTELKMRLRRG